MLKGRSHRGLVWSATHQNGKNYLFRLAVEGYNRLLQQKHFTKSKTSENAFVQYRMNNDILYQ